MSEIKIIEKVVTPNANWTQLIVDTHNKTVTQCAYKIKFDRTYPYFWVCPRFGGVGNHGLALINDDIERAAVFDEETGLFTKFDLTVDGILPLDGNTAICIAMGARQAFYLLSNAKYTEGGGGLHTFYISAQDDPVCPFVSANPFVG